MSSDEQSGLRAPTRGNAYLYGGTRAGESTTTLGGRIWGGGGAGGDGRAAEVGADSDAGSNRPKFVRRSDLGGLGGCGVPAALTVSFLGRVAKVLPGYQATLSRYVNTPPGAGAPPPLRVHEPVLRPPTRSSGPASIAFALLTFPRRDKRIARCVVHHVTSPHFLI
jgi:hypothetical protein